jgi:hypothetical protein
VLAPLRFYLVIVLEIFFIHKLFKRKEVLRPRRAYTLVAFFSKVEVLGRLKVLFSLASFFLNCVYYQVFAALEESRLPRLHYPIRH